MIRIFFISLFAFIAGFILKGILENWDVLTHTFMDVKITDVVQVLVLSCVGIYASFYINVKSSNEEKQKEIISSQIERLISMITGVYSLACEYIVKPKEDKGRKILFDLKEASVLLGLIEKNLKQRRCLFELLSKCKKSFIIFKRDVTGKPFLSTGATYTVDHDIKVHKAYADFHAYLDDLRFKQYL